MNNDAYFEIGSSHLICEDHALSGACRNMNYAIVSDGCSSAPDTHIGSQILCYSARYFLSLYRNLLDEGISLEAFSTIIGNSILQRSDNIRRFYSLSRASLQATLLISIIKNNETYILGWGDGILILLRDLVGENVQNVLNTAYDMDIIHIEYPETNAPFYLVTDEKEYADRFGEDCIVRHNHHDSSKGDNLSYDFKFTKSFCKKYNNSEKKIRGVILGTDGFNQYQKCKKNMDLLDVIPLITDYPNINGSFLKRTMRFMKRDQELNHVDDIGIAGIINCDEK